MSRVVLDASIVLAWCFPDEKAALAQNVAEMFKRGDTAIAPSFWPHEVLNALLVGEKRKRISKELVRQFLDDLATLPIALEQVPSGIVFGRMQRLSREHGLNGIPTPLTSTWRLTANCRSPPWTMTWPEPAGMPACG